MTLLLSILLQPLSAEGLVLVITAFFGGIAGIIYAIKSIPRQAPTPPPDPNEAEIVRAVDRHGQSLINLNDAMAKVSLAVTPSAKPFAPVHPPAPIAKPPEAKP